MNGIRWTLEDVEDYERRRRKPDSPPVTAPPAPRQESKLEMRFDQKIIEAGLPEPRKNWFFLNDRNFELDRAYPLLKIAVEIQGMAHRIKGKFKRDIEKRALAMLAGWRVLEVDGESIKNGKAIEWLKLLLETPTAAELAAVEKAWRDRYSKPLKQKLGETNA